MGLKQVYERFYSPQGDFCPVGRTATSELSARLMARTSSGSLSSTGAISSCSGSADGLSPWAKSRACSVPKETRKPRRRGGGISWDATRRASRLVPLHSLLEIARMAASESCCSSNPTCWLVSPSKRRRGIELLLKCSSAGEGNGQPGASARTAAQVCHMRSPWPRAHCSRLAWHQRAASCLSEKAAWGPSVYSYTCFFNSCIQKM